MKERGKNPQDPTNEEKRAKLSVKEFGYNSNDDPKSQDRIERTQESLNIFNKLPCTGHVNDHTPIR